MRSDYRAREGVRPCRSEPSCRVPARLFLCLGCRAQVLICSHCDRGHVYCAKGCAQKARRRSMRAAGHRYQTSRRGRMKHAERSRRYRARKNTVTHQGSPADGPLALLSEAEVVNRSETRPSDDPDRRRWCCDRCGRPCPAFFRRDFLQRCRGPWNNRRGPHRDHFP